MISLVLHIAKKKQICLNYLKNSLMTYILQTERLGLRNWNDSLIEQMVAISADPEVMRYFPYTASREQTYAFGKRMIQMCEAKSYCYFAAEILSLSLIHI